MEATPFYKVYPIEEIYRFEMERERELEKLKEFYPSEVRRIQKIIENRVDELEFEGSRIYDENPDHRMLEQEVDNIYNQVRSDEWLKSLIQVMLGQEIYCRRCRNKRWN